MKGIPLIIGFSRDLDIKNLDEKATKEIRDRLNYIKIQYANTDLMVMASRLTEFDRLVYQVATEMALPFIEVKPKLATLNQSPPSCYEDLDLGKTYGLIDLDQFEDYSGDRFDLGYKGLAQFLAIYSDVLVVCWRPGEIADDWLAKEKMGEGIEDETHYIIQLRKGHSEAFDLDGQFKNYGAKGPLLVINSKTFEYNWDIELGNNAYLKDLNSENKKMDLVNPSYQEYKTYFSKQAGQLKRGHEYMIAWLFLCAVGAIVNFEAFGYIADIRIVYGFYFMTFMFIVSYKMYEGTKLHRRFVDNRLLSEMMRITIYWKEVGITKNLNKVISHKNHFLIQDILEVYYSVYLLEYINRGDIPQTVDQSGWFKDQTKYFKKNISDYDAELKKTVRLEKSLLAIYIVLGVMTMIARDLDFIGNLLSFAGGLAAVVGIIVTYRQMTVFDDLVDGYVYMLQVHEKAQRLYESKEFHDHEGLFTHVARIALEENIDWYRMNLDKNGQFSIL